jgi:hypothetical protein
MMSILWVYNAVMKFIAERPFADPAAARKLMEIANATEAVQDGRIHIEKINGPFLYAEGGAGRIRRRLEAGDRARLAVDARERDVREIHGCGSGAVRLTFTANPNGDSLCRRSTM